MSMVKVKWEILPRIGRVEDIYLESPIRSGLSWCMDMTHLRIHALVPTIEWVGNHAEAKMRRRFLPDS